MTASGGTVRLNDAPIRSQIGGPGFQLAASYRLSPTVSVGGIGSHWYLESGGRLSRFTGEARYHVVHARFLDVWGGAELGLATYLEVPIPSPADSVVPGATAGTPLERTRFAPMGALGAGVDFLPLPYVSLGLDARALGAVFGYSEHQPSGLTPAAFLGLTLAVHVPTN
jgi:hypothetical protein